MKKVLITLLAALTASGMATSEPLQLETETGALFGTLEIPEGEGPFPVALIHPGSGPTDRNGNSAAIPGENNSLEMLAAGLAEQGIASLRIDKRGIGQSAGAAPPEAELRPETFVDDALLWLEQLEADERFEERFFVGHSEGALIGILAAQRSDLAGLVSIAGPGERLSETLRRQLSAQLPPQLMEEVEQVLGELEAGRQVEELPPGIAGIPAVAQGLFRPSVQPYLISTLAYHPAQEIAELDIPVLVLQGTTDLQVTVNDAEALAQAAEQSRLRIIEGMNHVLKVAPADPAANAATYGNPDLPLAPGLIAAISSFVEQQVD